MKEIQKIEWPVKGLYRVKRTSQYDSEEPPCEGAIPYRMKTVDRRAVDDPNKIPSLGDKWYTTGDNHRIENGQICRDIGWELAWFIRLDDIFDFVRKHDICVIFIDESGHETIEIYDDYRE